MASAAKVVSSPGDDLLGQPAGGVADRGDVLDPDLTGG